MWAAIAPSPIKHNKHIKQGIYLSDQSYYYFDLSDKNKSCLPKVKNPQQVMEDYKKLENYLMLGEAYAFAGPMESGLISMSKSEKKFWEEVRETRKNFYQKIKTKEIELLQQIKKKEGPSAMAILYLKSMEELYLVIEKEVTLLNSKYQHLFLRWQKLKLGNGVLQAFDNISAEDQLWIQLYWQAQKIEDDRMKSCRKDGYKQCREVDIKLWEKALSRLQEASTIYQLTAFCVNKEWKKRADLKSDGVSFKVPPVHEEKTVRYDLF